MTSGRKIVATWSALSADELAEQVRAHVRVSDGTTRAVWAAVRDDQVLRARVRGALSGLKAEFRGHRDEAMWLLWITRVQQQLAAEPKPAAPAPEPERDWGVEPVAEQGEAPAVTPVAAPAATKPRPQVPMVVFQTPAG
ncbi:hypothetical protein [Saccharothrix obliqua]|uniref:hypothetical protein n=1 Tax=Saccharothrix obliqua TaxID=2861747 RepID=UPI001C60320F|nr:hypothetical protein [Saccharothrix obliqua]MBW4718456.1 hypothetical protein [Saccharothrix obliqua]